MKVTPLNLTLFAIGLVVMLVGLYRMVSIEFASRKVTWNFVLQVGPLVVALAVVAFMIWTHKDGGTQAVVRGLKGTLKVASGYMPTVILLFVVMSFGGVLATLHYEKIRHMLLGDYGVFGTLGASFIVPTANTVADPIKQFWEVPAIRPLLLYFLTAAALVSWPIFFFRVLGLTFEIGWRMYLVNWGVAIAILPVFWLWSRLAAHGPAQTMMVMPVLSDVSA